MKENVFTVENAKVAAVDYRLQSVGREGYINNGEALVFVKVSKVFVDLVKREVVTTFKDKDGNEYTQTGDCRFYGSPREFENNSTLHYRNCSTASILGELVCDAFVDRKNLCGVSFMNAGCDENGTQYIYKEAWRFENGEAVKTPIVVHSVVYDKDGVCLCKLVDGCIPDRLYRDAESAFSFNEYKVIDEDGDEFIERGVNLRLSLTKEQSAILDELKAAFKKAIDANIRFAWDRDNCGTIGAFNKNDVDEYGYEAEGKGGVTIEARNAFLEDTGIYFYDFVGGDNCDVICMKPTEREKKLMEKNK